jgi:predicted Zn-dependent protease
LGFFNIYPMRYSFVADHFAYLAAPALITAVVAAWMRLGRAAVVPAGTVVLGLLAVLTWNQSHIYRGAETIWRDTIRKNPSSWMARFNLAVCLSAWADADRAGGDEQAAQRKLSEALDLLGHVELLRPQHEKLQRTRATVMAGLGRHDEALAILGREVEQQPHELALRVMMAQVYEQSGNVDEALQQLRRLVSQHGQQPRQLLELGLMLSRHGRPAEARPLLEQYVEQRPNDVDGHIELGFVYGELGRFSAAADQFDEALRRDPTSKKAQQGMELVRRARPGR